MATPMRKLRISDSDWSKINELAVSAGMSASAWLLQAAKEKAAPHGVKIEGAAPEGNPNIATLRRRNEKGVE